MTLACKSDVALPSVPLRPPAQPSPPRPLQSSPGHPQCQCLQASATKPAQAHLPLSPAGGGASSSPSASLPSIRLSFLCTPPALSQHTRGGIHSSHPSPLATRPSHPSHAAASRPLPSPCHCGGQLIDSHARSNAPAWKGLGNFTPHFNPPSPCPPARFKSGQSVP